MREINTSTGPERVEEPPSSRRERRENPDLKEIRTSFVRRGRGEKRESSLLLVLLVQFIDTRVYQDKIHKEEEVEKSSSTLPGLVGDILIQRSKPKKPSSS